MASYWARVLPWVNEDVLQGRGRRCVRCHTAMTLLASWHCLRPQTCVHLGIRQLMITAQHSTCRIVIGFYTDKSVRARREELALWGLALNFDFHLSQIDTLDVKVGRSRGGIHLDVPTKPKQQRMTVIAAAGIYSEAQEPCNHESQVGMTNRIIKRALVFASKLSRNEISSFLFKEFNSIVWYWWSTNWWCIVKIS